MSRVYYGDDEPLPTSPPNEAGCFLAVLTENAEPGAPFPASPLGFVPNLRPPEPTWHEDGLL